MYINYNRYYKIIKIKNRILMNYYNVLIWYRYGFNMK